MPKKGLLGILLVALAVRLCALSIRTLSWDEAVNVKDAGSAPSRLLHRLIAVEKKPPFHFMVAHLLLRAGGGIGSLRVLSLACGMLLILTAWWIGRQLAGAEAARWAALFAALSSGSVWESGLTRYYAMASLLVACHLGLFLAWVRDAAQGRFSRAREMALVCVALLLLYTSYFASFILAGEALAVFQVLRPNRAVRFAGLLGLAGVLFLPWMPFLARSFESGNFFPGTSRSDGSIR